MSPREKSAVRQAWSEAFTGQWIGLDLATQESSVGRALAALSNSQPPKEGISMKFWPFNCRGKTPLISEQQVAEHLVLLRQIAADVAEIRRLMALELSGGAPIPVAAGDVVR